MILNRLKVRGFRSIQSSVNNFWIDKGLTILVGANEHGKSNLLDAISYLNETTFEDSDKCRSKNFDKGDGNFPQVEFYLTFNKDEKETLEAHLKEVRESLPETVESKDDKALEQMLNIVIKDIEKRETFDIRVSVHTGFLKSYFYCFKNKSERLLNIQNPLNLETATVIEESLPKVVSFGPEDVFPDGITLAEIEQNKVWQGLLKLGTGVWEEKEKLFENDIDGREFLEESKKKIQRKLRSIWSQGRQDQADLKIDLTLDASTDKIILDFIDTTGTRDQLSHRSLGFKSFFSFYLKLFSETSEIEPHGYIFVFDEPGLHLHPSAQKDLLREVRQMSQDNQIIFSTHSPFLIDRHPSTKVAVISKGSEGTKIDQKPYRRNWSPLRSSLGLVMNDTFFYADKTLLVEGTSDRIFIASLLQKFSERFEIDVNFLCIIDGDDGKVQKALARIMLSEDRNIVSLTDSDDAGKKLNVDIKEMALLMKKGELLDVTTYLDFINVDQNLSIEDLLPEEVLEKATQKYLKEIIGSEDEFKLADLPDSKETLGRKLELYFLEKEWTSKSSTFSKTTVADFFARELLDWEQDLHEDHKSLVLCKELKEKLDLK